MRLCFVGYGSIAEAHARAFQELGCEFHCVVGRAPESTAEFAERWGFRRWTLELDEGLAEDVDGVVITSPSDRHAAQAIRALQAGKHVLVEIPIATTVDDAMEVAAAAFAARRRVQVAHTQRYYPALLELRRRIQGGEFHPHHAVCQWYFLRRENVNWKGRRRSWTDNLLWHHGCHVVDAMLWLFTDLREDLPRYRDVSAQFGPPHAELGIPLDLDLQFRVGELPVSISMSYNSPVPRHEYFLIGEETSIAYREGKLWGPDGVLWEAPEGEGRSILEQDREWLSAVREERKPAVDPRTVVPAMTLLARAEHAGAKGKPRVEEPKTLRSFLRQVGEVPPEGSLD